MYSNFKLLFKTILIMLIVHTYNSNLCEPVELDSFANIFTEYRNYGYLGGGSYSRTYLMKNIKNGKLMAMKFGIILTPIAFKDKTKSILSKKTTPQQFYNEVKSLAEEEEEELINEMEGKSQFFQSLLENSGSKEKIDQNYLYDSLCWEKNASAEKSTAITDNTLDFKSLTSNINQDNNAHHFKLGTEAYALNNQLENDLDTALNNEKKLSDVFEIENHQEDSIDSLHSESEEELEPAEHSTYGAKDEKNNNIHVSSDKKSIDRYINYTTEDESEYLSDSELEDEFYYYKLKLGIFKINAKSDIYVQEDEEFAEETFADMLIQLDNEISSINQLNQLETSEKDYKLVPDNYGCVYVDGHFTASAYELTGPNLNQRYIKILISQLTFQRKLTVFIKIVELIHKLHEKDYVHCDISPDNIVVELGDIEHEPNTISEIIKTNEKAFIKSIKEVYNNNNPKINSDLIKNFKNIEFDKENYYIIDLDGLLNVKTTNKEEWEKLKPEKKKCTMYKETHFPEYEQNENLQPDELKTKDVFALGLSLLKLDSEVEGMVDVTSYDIRNPENTNYKNYHDYIDQRYSFEKLNLNVPNNNETMKLKTSYIALKHVLKAMLRPNYHLLNDDKNEVLSKFPDIRQALLNKGFEPLDISQYNEIDDITLKNLFDKKPGDDNIIPDEKLYDQLPRRLTIEETLKALESILLFNQEQEANYHDFMEELLEKIGFKLSLYKKHLLADFDKIISTSPIIDNQQDNLLI